MSRRTKLCITALFLLLLAIPIGYVGLAWCVRNPLRFRYVAQGKPEMRYDDPFAPSQGRLMVGLHLEVENTAFVPVFISEAAWTFKGIENEPHWGYADHSCLRNADIPARRVNHGEVYVTPEQARILTGREMTMYYKWITTAQMRVQELVMNAADRAERNDVFNYLMELHPEMKSDLVPIENASNAP